MKNTGMNMIQVKKQNRASVFNCVNQCGPVSRKDIAQITGLTPAAVTLICNELIQQGLLQELGVDTLSTGAGRKKVLLTINYDRYHIITVNIESSDTFLSISNMKGECLEQITIPTDRDADPEVFLVYVAKLCREMRERYPEVAKKLAGVRPVICAMSFLDTGPH